MRSRLVRLAIAAAALAGAAGATFALTAGSGSAQAIGKTGSDCSGTYVVGIQVVGPPIYCSSN